MKPVALIRSLLTEKEAELKRIEDNLEKFPYMSIQNYVKPDGTEDEISWVDAYLIHLTTVQALTWVLAN